MTVAVMAAVLMIATASSAQATPNTSKAWGRNDDGQLGTGMTEGPEKCGTEMKTACSTTPVEVSKLSGVTALSAGEKQSLALLENGTAMAWGDPVGGFGGSLGNGTTERSNVPVAVCAPAPEPCPGSRLSEVAAVASSRFDNVALLKNGAVMDWGYGSEGALGNGANEASAVPVAVSGLSEPVKAIAAGEGFGLALLKGGTVMAWGRNGAGQLGNGATTNSDVPVQVKGLTGVTAIAAGLRFALAVLSDGTVMAWGANGQGQLGNGTETASNVPVAVSGLKEVIAVAGGAQHSLALLQNGTVMAWGDNVAGELGDGSHTGPENCGTLLLPCAKTPVAVSGLKGVTAIAGGNGHSLALLGGTVEAWGSNNYGQLGDGTSTGPEPCGTNFGPCSATPVEVSKLSDVKGIAAGTEAFSLAFGPPPAVTGLTPKLGPASGGTSVSISGTDFTGTTAVEFGSTKASSFTVLSPTSITAVAPVLPAGPADVTVTNTWGTSAISAGDRFTVTPTVTGVSPGSGPAAGGISVTVTGSGFIPGSTAARFKFANRKAKSVNCSSTTTCTVLTPRYAQRTVDVRATVNNTTSPTNRPSDQFTYR
jgi:alpha-tubulin suppressor-like RCC1 family protein